MSENLPTPGPPGPPGPSDPAPTSEPPTQRGNDHKAWRPDRARMTLILCFVLALTAGAVAGLVAGGHVKPPHAGGRIGSWFAANLDLSAQQQEQLRKIWSPEPNAPAAGTGENRHALEQKRDKAVRDLLTGEQVAAYDRIMDDYSQKLEELSKQRHDWFTQAVEKTRQVLTPEQQTKFDTFLRERRASWSGHHAHGTTEPATRPGAEMR